MLKKIQTKKIIYLGFILVILYCFMVAFTLYEISIYHSKFSDFIYNLNLFYSPQRLYHSLNLLPSNLRKIYLLVASIDIIVALLYGLFGFFLASTILRQQKSRLIGVIPFLFLIAAFFNIFEDISLGYIYLTFPQFHWNIAFIANILTTLKIASLSIGIIVLLYVI